MFLITMIRKEIYLIRYLRRRKLIWMKSKKAFRVLKINLELKMSKNLRNKLNKIRLGKEKHQKI